jgi:hypothetical protein
MNEYLINRKGSNSANQSMQEIRPLMLIDAETMAEARQEFESTWMEEFTFYANQTVYIQDVSDLNEEEYDIAQEVDHETRQHIREGNGVY